MVLYTQKTHEISISLEDAQTQAKACWRAPYCPSLTQPDPVPLPDALAVALQAVRTTEEALPMARTTEAAPRMVQILHSSVTKQLAAVGSTEVDWKLRARRTTAVAPQAARTRFPPMHKTSPPTRTAT